MSLLEFKDVSFSYDNNERSVKILENVSAVFEKGKLYTVVGESGSGKTTALSLAGALEDPKKGAILYNGKDLKKIGYSTYRRDYLSFIFQNYNLVKYMSVLDNVLIAMDIKGLKKSKKEKIDIAIKTLESLGIGKELLNRNVLKLSGGQQQRVAIARALVKDTDLILADEPTGNLDDDTTDEIVKIFDDLAHKYGKCVIIVTHTNRLSDHADTVYKFKNKTLIAM